MIAPSSAHRTTSLSINSVCQACGRPPADADKISRYIESESGKWRERRIDRYLRKEDTGLPFTIQYSGAADRVYVHFKRFANAPKYIGEGIDKHAVLTLDWYASVLEIKSTSKIVNRAKQITSQNEFQMLDALQDIHGVLRLKSALSYKGRNKDKKFAMVVEYCNGGDLFDALFENRRLGPLSAEMKFWIVYDVLSTVSHLHRRGICHRDLKPENIFLRWDEASKRWRGVVGDFGNACPSEYLSVAEVKGTEGYIAPECLNLDSPLLITEKIDVWSLGECLYWIFWLERQSDAMLASLITDMKATDIYMRPDISLALGRFESWGRDSGFIDANPRPRSV